MTTLPPSMFGVPVRAEDPRFLTGRGRYVEDLPIEGALRAVFVRSIMAHAGLSAVEVEVARAMPGVAGVFTRPARRLSGVVEGSSDALEGPFGREPLARGVVRFVGEAIAVVVADTPAHAEDAAEAVVGDYDLLPSVIDVRRRSGPAPRACGPSTARTSSRRSKRAGTTTCSREPRSSRGGGW